MAWLALKFNGEQIDPATLNPYREAGEQREEKKSEVRQQAENVAGWAAIETALFGRVIKPRG